MRDLMDMARLAALVTNPAMRDEDHMPTRQYRQTNPLRDLHAAWFGRQAGRHRIALIKFS